MNNEPIIWQTDFQAEPEKYCVYLGVDPEEQQHRTCVYEVGVFHSLRAALAFADQSFGLTAALAIKQLPHGITADEYDGKDGDERLLVAGATIERFTDQDGTIEAWDKNAGGAWDPMPAILVSR